MYVHVNHDSVLGSKKKQLKEDLFPHIYFWVDYLIKFKYCADSLLREL